MLTNLSWRTAMEWVLGVVIIGLSVFDLCVELIDAHRGELGATISEITIHTLYAHPVASLFMGCLLGHLTFPVAQTRPGSVTALLVVAFIIMGIVADRIAAIPPLMPVIPLVIGIICGHILWPQKISTETGETLIVYKAGSTVNLDSRTMTQTITPKR